MTGALAIPETARRKVLKPRWWASEQPVTVYLQQIPVSHDARRFGIYAEDGTYLGFIEEYRSHVTTRVPGTRLVRHGKRRTFWAANGTALWQQHPSQADAIRRLIADTQPKGAL